MSSIIRIERGELWALFQFIPIRGNQMKAKQDQESRLDRIEKALENLLQGTAELKESQKKTDEQLNRTIKKLDEIGKQLGDIGLVQGVRLLRTYFSETCVIFSKKIAI